jgi:hypothetical protein
MQSTQLVGKSLQRALRPANLLKKGGGREITLAHFLMCLSASPHGSGTPLTKSTRHGSQRMLCSLLSVAGVNERKLGLPFPDFVVIGAQKAGTTWLYRNLSVHPDIWTPPLKELHYFDERIQEPSFGALVARLLGKEHTTESWYPWFWRYQLNQRLQRHRKNFNLEGVLWDIRFFLRSPSDKWYASLFKQGHGKITGEVTPAYSNLEADVIAHVYKLMPSAKIIFFMRNPIERGYSTTVKRLDDQRLRDQHVEASTDEQIYELSRDPGLINSSLISEVRYLQSLEKWRKFYPDEQIFIGFLEDIHFNPRRLLRCLYRFLGVDPSHARHHIRGRVNSGSQGKMPILMAAHLAHTYYEDLECLSTRFRRLHLFLALLRREAC